MKIGMVLIWPRQTVTHGDEAIRDYSAKRMQFVRMHFGTCLEANKVASWGHSLRQNSYDLRRSPTAPDISFDGHRSWFTAMMVQPANGRIPLRHLFL